MSISISKILLEGGGVIRRQLTFLIAQKIATNIKGTVKFLHPNLYTKFMHDRALQFLAAPIGCIIVSKVISINE